SRLAKNRPFAIAWGIAWIFIILALSYMGLPQYGIETPAATRVIQDLAPEEGLGPLREVPHQELIPGIYTVGEDYGKELCPDLIYQPGFDDGDEEVVYGCSHLNEVFFEFSEGLLKAEEEGKLDNLHAYILIEDFQEDLKLVAPHVEWTEGALIEEGIKEGDTVYVVAYVNEDEQTEALEITLSAPDESQYADRFFIISGVIQSISEDGRLWMIGDQEVVVIPFKENTYKVDFFLHEEGWREH
ncbi:MAG: hypothetical protein N2C13_03530, partial [Chloroflexota bacterium]